MVCRDGSATLQLMLFSRSPCFWGNLAANCTIWENMFDVLQFLDWSFNFSHGFASDCNIWINNSLYILRFQICSDNVDVFRTIVDPTPPQPPQAHVRSAFWVCISWAVFFSTAKKVILDCCSGIPVLYRFLFGLFCLSPLCCCSQDDPGCVRTYYKCASWMCWIYACAHVQ